MATSETTPRPDGAADTLAGQHVQGVGDPGHHALGVAEAALPKGVTLEASREESALEATRQQIAALGVTRSDDDMRGVASRPGGTPQPGAGPPNPNSNPNPSPSGLLAESANQPESHYNAVVLNQDNPPVYSGNSRAELSHWYALAKEYYDRRRLARSPVTWRPMIAPECPVGF